MSSVGRESPPLWGGILSFNLYYQGRTPLAMDFCPSGAKSEPGRRSHREDISGLFLSVCNSLANCAIA